MDPDARKLFLDYLANDSENLHEYYLEHIAPYFGEEYTEEKAQDGEARTYTQARASMVMTNLENNLASIAGMPKELLNAFLALGTSIIAPLLDGPLPVADLISIIAAALAGVGIISHWDYVTEHWKEIVSAFEEAFATTSVAGDMSSSFEDAYEGSPLQKLKELQDDVRNAPQTDSADRHLSGDVVSRITRSTRPDLGVYGSSVNQVYLLVYRVPNGIWTKVSADFKHYTYNKQNESQNIGNWKLFVLYNAKTNKIFHAHLRRFSNDTEQMRYANSLNIQYWDRYQKNDKYLSGNKSKIFHGSQCD